MSDRPILFSGPMIRALMEARKTQTRRILKPRPESGYDVWQDEDSGEWFKSTRFGDWALPGVRFGKGDRLWVRETFSGKHDYDVEKWPPRAWFPGDAIWYWADGSPTAGDWTRPKPGIHMPRWASRLTLTVTDVRVQKLQELTEGDALAEGVECYENTSAPLVTFAKLWNAINKDERHSWQSNPWVCAVTFRPELNSAKSPD